MPPALRLRLVDVNGKLLSEAADVMLRRQSTSVMSKVRSQAGKMLKITDLSADVYSVQVDPPSYRAAGAFVMIGSSITTLTMTFPVDPAKVTGIIAPAFGALGADLRRVLTDTQNLLGFTGVSGADLYRDIDDIRKAGLLNIMAKTGATVLSNGRTVSSYLVKLLELRGDRFHAVVPQELREETKNSAQAGLFFDVPEGMHHPPLGFEHAGSWKTFDLYGNLQLTFFSKGADWVADIDIDDAGGLAHVFQVLRNELTRTPTHPYNIHEILIKYQMLDPGYGFDT
jgi:hypothetical protein